MIEIRSTSARVLLSLGIFLLVLCSSFATEITYDKRGVKIDGQRRILLSGAIHYPRSSPAMWPDLIKKSKDGGLNTIETYVFWNAHEPQRRQYDFSGNLDLVRFMKTVQDEGMYAILRIGPYTCAEWNYGGLPVWLHNLPGVEIRTNNNVFKNEMQTFVTLMVNMMKKENLFASQGGPIILAQIENEYGNVNSVYGEDGKAYLNWCAELALSYKVGVPWVMCQESDAPSSMINTCNGFYCDQFKPNGANSPKMWTENWSGWFKDWGNRDPHRTAEDLAYSVAKFFQTGGTLQNYYMYHGGTNFGRSAGGPYITTSYDYDAPLDEYGNLNQPKWGHLKELHSILVSLEKTLTYGTVRNLHGGNVTVTVFSLNGESSCFFANSDAEKDQAISYEGRNYTIPAWSVTILPDCQTEVYNTAKINTQKSFMVKKVDEDDESSAMTWEWMPENIQPMTLGNVKPSLTANELLEQKTATNDTSDYLWYMTSFDVNGNEPTWKKDVTLRVNTSGHILHAFLNGDYVGTQHAQNGTYKFVFEHDVTVKAGKNQLSLLSVTVGLQNYGGQFDMVKTGVTGPVQLIGTNAEGDEVIKDLSNHEWNYKIGLESNTNNLDKWTTENLPTDKMFTWYKTEFEPPLGSDPVVVDLIGLGKGEAWVNGQSLGRYWPTFIADEDGCAPCDYRGKYDPVKCATNCGKPTQRWYHVPRSFLHDKDNTLVLFEEFGGTPLHVKFGTVAVGNVCANVREGKTLELCCHGKPISAIKFASFGNPGGACGSFAQGTCASPNALQVIQKACVGQEKCSLEVTEETLGATGCGSQVLAVEAVCQV